MTPQAIGDVTDRSTEEGLEPLDPNSRQLQRLQQRPVPRHAAPGWRRDRQKAVRVPGDQTRPAVGGTRIFTSLLDRVLDNSNRRQYGMGWVGRMFG